MTLFSAAQNWLVKPGHRLRLGLALPSVTSAASSTASLRPLPHPLLQVLHVVPEEFVGTASRLVPLVQTLCAEMAAAFRASGATLPPWRWAKSMLSK